MSEVSIGKEYITEGEGLPVRIYATDGAGIFPVQGAVFEDGGWSQHSWHENGTHPFNYYNLVEKPQVKSVWRNVYSDAVDRIHNSRYDADLFCAGNRIAVLRIDEINGEYTAHLEEI